MLEEMCVAFSSKSRPVFEVWDEYFKRIDEFRLKVVGAITETICGVLGRDSGDVGTEEEVKLGIKDGEGEVKLDEACVE